MSCRISIEIDLMRRLEGEIIFNDYFDFNVWSPDDTGRLKKIVEFLEQQEKKAGKGK